MPPDGDGLPHHWKRERPAKLCGGVMIRISIAYFYRLGTQLARLRQLRDGMKESDARGIVYTANNELLGLLGEHMMSGAMRACYEPGQALSRTLRQFLSRPYTDGQAALDFMDAWSITDAYNRFETVFNAEMAIANAYFVTNKGAYDTLELISRGETLFPLDLPQKAPEAISDIREAGKCLAFELSTAAGFHALRAVESVLRRYWKVVSGGAPHPPQKNVGVYLKKMEQAKVGNKKVIAALTQIKDLHRNPLMHPDEILNVDEAISLLGVVQSAVQAMLKEMPIVEIEPPADPLADIAPINPLEPAP